MQGRFHGSKKRAKAEEKLSPSLPASPTANRGKHSIGGDDSYPHNSYKSISDSDRKASAKLRQAIRQNGLTHKSAFQKVCAARDMLYVTDQQSNRSFLVDTGSPSASSLTGEASPGVRSQTSTSPQQMELQYGRMEYSRNPSNLGRMSTWQTSYWLK